MDQTEGPGGEPREALEAIRSFRVDLSEWEDFDLTSNAAGRTRGAQIRHLIKSENDAFRRNGRAAA